MCTLISKLWLPRRPGNECPLTRCRQIKFPPCCVQLLLLLLLQLFYYIFFCLMRCVPKQPKKRARQAGRKGGRWEQALHHIINSTLRCKIEFNQSINQRCVMPAETFKQLPTWAWPCQFVVPECEWENRSKLKHKMRNVYAATTRSPHLRTPLAIKHSEASSHFYCLVNFYSSYFRHAYAIRIPSTSVLPLSVWVCLDSYLNLFVFAFGFVFGASNLCCSACCDVKVCWLRCIEFKFLRIAYLFAARILKSSRQ